MDYTEFAQRHALGVILTLLVGAPVGGVALWRVLASCGRRVGAVMALLAICCGGTAFVAIARRVGEGASFAAADQRMLDALRHGLPEGTVRFFAFVTHFGDPWVLTLLCAVCCVALVVARRLALAVYLAVVTSLGGLVNHALKLLVRRARPVDAFVPLPESFSFPSGHTFGSVVCYGMCAYVLMRIVPRGLFDAAIVGVACFVVVLIGVSRVVVGVHFPADVVAGIAAGGVWLAACIWLLEACRRG